MGVSQLNDFFWTTISCVKGVGSKTLIQLYENYPYLNFDNLKEYVPALPRKNWIKLLAAENIDIAKQRANNLIKIHEAKDIAVIPISSEWYPEYLRLIDDPPITLYAKGNLDLLKVKNNLAIVGTREPTEIGIKSTHKIATTFAEFGYTIVSGLALGIDTAAHEGALMAENGKTITVLAGNLTQIYPAKNKQLALDILEHDGLWLSETPIGQANNRGNFVKRNRIQSGLSLGVCPIQTPLKSGTQHTIEFSRKQERFLFTPIPLKQDLHEQAIQGNLELIKNEVPVLKSKASYEIIDSILLDYKSKLDREHEQRFAKEPIQEEKPNEAPNKNIKQFNLVDLTDHF